MRAHSGDIRCAFMQMGFAFGCRQSFVLPGRGGGYACKLDDPSQGITPTITPRKSLNDTNFFLYVAADSQTSCIDD